ncbi:aldehyde dehydrogenase [Flavisolibacter ginsenosidimutans]|uniref:Aldehyde dehydrogenase n=1 Tax=Flavisolibacter ginsenosidimutans TaxID=661481 RepID=A0A5B8UL86_9BACT|nr:aldehyde dehydrogenase [Flavisolibacter ginsenosidimutans]QEC57206.1 aldehyde dehydrogenase [Flavisolibacter ginsenosidimutans]
MESSIQPLQKMRRYFESGATQPYAFRKQMLEALRNAITQYEDELMQALYADLKKNKEESWVTEIGFVQAEIRHALKHVHRWMKPQKVATNLLNFPGKSFVYKEPLGVVLIIGPWNYPLQLLFAPLVGAIAAGNCVVLKPSEFATATAAVMKRLIKQIFAPEYILCVEGEGAQVVPDLMNNFRFDHVFYTGSTAVGKAVYEMAAKQLVPVTLELGGKSPCVVESDADLKVAARRIALTKFSNAGQMCVAPDYVLVHRSAKDVFVRELISAIKRFFSEEPSSNYNYGKIINERAFNRLIKYMEQGRVIYGGKTDMSLHYIEPTLLDDVPLDATVMGEEIFGPVLTVLSFENFDEAKSIINRNSNPLAFYVFTSNKEKEERWLREVPFGGGCVNNASWHLTNFNLPFGGRGASGIGAYHGEYSFAVFSHQKAVMKTPTWFDPAVKYPPFEGKLKLFKKIIR